MLVGGVATWIVFGGDQFIVPFVGLMFVPLLALRPLMQVQVEFVAFGSYLLGLLGIFVLWCLALHVVAMSSLAWLGIILLDTAETSRRPLLFAASILTGTFGLLMLSGFWGMQAADNAPALRPICIVYPVALMLASGIIWPHRGGPTRACSGRRDRAADEPPGR